MRRFRKSRTILIFWSTCLLAIFAVGLIDANSVAAKEKSRLRTVVPRDLGDDGPIAEAWLGGLKDLAIDSQGNLYFPDLVFNIVRQVNPSSGRVTRISGTGTQGYSGDGGKADKAQLAWPFSLAIDPEGNLYISDFGNNVVRFVNRSRDTVKVFGILPVRSGEIATVVGTGNFGYSGDGGTATAAELRLPRGMTLHRDAAGEPLSLYFADIDNHAIRRVDGRTGIITTIAGTGLVDCSLLEGVPSPPPCSPLGDGGDPTQAAVSFPTSLAFDSFGNLFILEFFGRVRKVKAGIISTIAGGGPTGFGGDNGPASEMRIAENPSAPTFDEAGNLFIADSNNHRIRRLEAIQGEVTADSLVTTVVGSGFSNIVATGYYSKADDGIPPTQASVNLPTGLAFHEGRLFLVQESGVIRVVDGGGNGLVDGGEDEIISDIGALGGLKQIFGIASDGMGHVFATEENTGRVREIDAAGNVSTVAGNAVKAFTIDGPGGDPRDDKGDGGAAGDAALGDPLRLGFDEEGNLYFTESYPILGIAGSLRRIRAEGGGVGPGSIIETVMEFPFIPVGIAVASETRQYIVDALESRIWEVNSENGTATLNLIAGSGSFGHSGDGGPAVDADIGLVFGLTIDENQENLYFGELSIGAIRRINLPTGVITTVFQLEGPFGFADPTDLVVAGNRIYVVDEPNAEIRLIDMEASPVSEMIVAGVGPFPFPLAFNGDGIATEVQLDDPIAIAIDPQRKTIYTGEGHGQRIRRLDQNKDHSIWQSMANTFGPR